MGLRGFSFVHPGLTPLGYWNVAPSALEGKQSTAPVRYRRGF